MAHRAAEESTTLGDLRRRIETTDLIPSQEPLLEQIAERFDRLAQAGIRSAVELQNSLKNKHAVATLAEASGVDADYLALLGRAVRGFFPKPKRLREFDWLAADLLGRLERAEIKNTRQFYRAARADRPDLAGRAQLTDEESAELLSLCDLSRVQWTSPTFARVLLAAGFDGAAAVASVDAETLYAAVAAANAESGFYNGKVGLRDIKRLIDAAGYVASSDAG